MLGSLSKTLSKTNLTNENTLAALERAVSSREALRGGTGKSEGGKRDGLDWMSCEREPIPEPAKEKRGGQICSEKGWSRCIYLAEEAAESS